MQRKEEKLTRRQKEFLLYLAERAIPCQLKEIAGELNVTMPSAHVTLSKLLKEGLIWKDEEHLYRITPQERQYLEKHIDTMRRLRLWLHETLGITQSKALSQSRSLTVCLSVESCEAILRAAEAGLLSSKESRMKKAVRKKQGTGIPRDAVTANRRKKPHQKDRNAVWLKERYSALGRSGLPETTELF